jgi:hypothetical protein
MSFEIDTKNKTHDNNVVSITKTLNSQFSPKDKLLLICSPLGGYSLLDPEKSAKICEICGLNKKKVEMKNNSPYQKFLEVSEPFFKKVLTRRRQSIK